MREVCGRHHLKPGEYIVIPTTFQPNEEAQLLVRVLTENASSGSVLDQPTLLLSSEVNCLEVFINILLL